MAQGDRVADLLREDAERLRTPAAVRVPVSALMSGNGIIAQDIVARDGSFSLPAGLDLSTLNVSLEPIVRRMREEGIDHIMINRVPRQLSDADIEQIIERAYEGAGGAQLIDKEKAAEVIHEVDAMYRNFENDESNADIVETLASMGEDLADELLKDPSVAFSLGKVRDADHYTFVHSFNVAILLGYLGNRLHPGDREYMRKLVIGGLLHDMGKSQIPKEILNKPGPLNKDEFEEMAKHPSIGVQLAIQCGVTDSDILAVIGGHHEKWSGRGYPNRRAGLDIPEPARIAAVADVFDALTARRVYKEALTSRSAVSMILKDAGENFDARIARELLIWLGLYPPGSIVLLSDGRQGVVVSGNGRDLIRPIVFIENEDAGPDDPPLFIDLKKTDLIIVAYIGHSSKRGISLASLPR